MEDNYYLIDKTLYTKHFKCHLFSIYCCLCMNLSLQIKSFQRTFQYIFSLYELHFNPKICKQAQNQLNKFNQDLYVLIKCCQV